MCVFSVDHLVFNNQLLYSLLGKTTLLLAAFLRKNRNLFIFILCASFCLHVCPHEGARSLGARVTDSSDLLTRVLGIEPTSSGRTATAPNYGAISPATS